MKANKPKPITTTYFQQSGIVGELIYDAVTHAMQFAVARETGVEKVATATVGDHRYTPPHQSARLAQSGTIKLPSSTLPYESEPVLISRIQAFIHQYIDLSDTFERICVHYVLLTWLYDHFNELPYLRVRGDYGTGKTRFLTVIGSICYKPIFASGASTTAPLFHLLNEIKGTLILDESDFRFSDATAELTKILNNGNARGFSVLRCEQLQEGKFSARPYSIYGPKILASRESFSDNALESRFITEDLGGRSLRTDIPISLPDAFEEEALTLRNMLLQYRFDHRNDNLKQYLGTVPAEAGRTQQIYLPLLSLIKDQETREKVEIYIKDYEIQLRTDRGLQTEAELLRIIKKLLERTSVPTISQVTNAFVVEYGQRYGRRITPKWIGYLLRSKLHLSTRKSNGVYVIGEGQDEKLTTLFQVYDVE